MSSEDPEVATKPPGKCTHDGRVRVVVEYFDAEEVAHPQTVVCGLCMTTLAATAVPHELYAQGDDGWYHPVLDPPGEAVRAPGLVLPWRRTSVGEINEREGW